ncbi:hypothetical protein PoB_000949300 [Plakobranchus ocellatus]|uniref:Uncharacterized protein n=1 Tax=Plakobranchus ocellatus TaxID=259542 RepID=A0AAV3YLA3_9GAST|nr:hypothetical protein PoB_000949300 [Plakobranchus ocellatus]
MLEFIEYQALCESEPTSPPSFGLQGQSHLYYEMEPPHGDLVCRVIYCYNGDPDSSEAAYASDGMICAKGKTTACTETRHMWMWPASAGHAHSLSSSTAKASATTIRVCVVKLAPNMHQLIQIVSLVTSLVNVKARSSGPCAAEVLPPAVSSATCPRQGGLRLCSPSSGQGEGGGARTRFLSVLVDLREDSPSILPPTSYVSLTKKWRQ